MAYFWSTARLSFYKRFARRVIEKGCQLSKRFGTVSDHILSHHHLARKLRVVWMRTWLLIHENWSNMFIFSHILTTTKVGPTRFMTSIFAQEPITLLLMTLPHYNNNIIIIGYSHMFDMWNG